VPRGAGGRTCASFIHSKQRNGHNGTTRIRKKQMAEHVFVILEKHMKKKKEKKKTQKIQKKHMRMAQHAPPR
jgi:hypothetical protein